MIRLMTLNLNFHGDRHGPWSERRPAIAAAIRRSRPDVVALQAVARAPAIEDGVDQAAQLARDLPGYAAVYRAAARHDDGREEGIAFLARLPLSELRAHPLSRRDGHEDPFRRVLLHATFAASGGPLHVFNAHLSWVEAQAHDNVTELLLHLRAADGPTILAGDFNQGPDSEALARLRGTGLVDAWSTLHPDAPGFTFHEHGAMTKRIDYVLVDPTLVPRLHAADRILDEPGERRPSDHAGLVVELA